MWYKYMMLGRPDHWLQSKGFSGEAVPVYNTMSTYGSTKSPCHSGLPLNIFHIFSQTSSELKSKFLGSKSSFWSLSIDSLRDSRSFTTARSVILNWQSVSQLTHNIDVLWPRAWHSVNHVCTTWLHCWGQKFKVKTGVGQANVDYVMHLKYFTWANSVENINGKVRRRKIYLWILLFVFYSDVIFVKKDKKAAKKFAFQNDDTWLLSIINSSPTVSAFI